MRILLSVGLCLVVAAMVIRTAASTLRRQIAQERQHERATGETRDSARLQTQERLLSRASFAIGLVGVALALVGLFWR